MKHRFVSAAIAAAILGVFASTAMSQADKAWVDIKGAKQLRALYSNKTFKGKDGWGNNFVGHYSPDGKGIFIVGDLRYPRTWEVKGNDQVCVTEARGTDCYTFQRNRKHRNQIKLRSLRRGFYTEITVEDGAPKF